MQLEVALNSRKRPPPIRMGSRPEKVIPDVQQRGRQGDQPGHDGERSQAHQQGREADDA